MPPNKSAADIALGAVIREARRQRGHTQESFASEAGIDRSYYGAVERGEFNLTVETILKISAGLGLTAAQLFERAGL